MNHKDYVLVLDLDDTIYKEKDYVLSGIHHICDIILKVTGHDIHEDVLNFHNDSSSRDFLKYAISISGLSKETMEDLLWSYRTHLPDITLTPSAKSFIEFSRNNFFKIAVLTDGRVISQSLKLAALNISDLPAFISEEWGSTKPSTDRFSAIQTKWYGKKYIYVGDNPVKDFIAPNGMGWITIGLLDTENVNIHPQSYRDLDDICQPKVWVNNLLDILSLPLDQYHA